MGLVHYMILFISISSFPFLGFASYCLNDYLQQSNRKFEQKTDRFWQFNEQSNSWVEVQLPYELNSCVNGNCTKVGSIDQIEKREDCIETIPQRRRLSLIRMSETSIWITGESGSIFERFWNGVQWVYAPHDLPVLAGPATCVLIVNQTILALSESGILYQMQIAENSQPIWVPVTPNLNSDTTNEAEVLLIKSGSVAHDGMRVYFCTKKGLLLELAEVEPLRWINHGRPPGGNVAAIADAGFLRPDVVYTISSAGDLYEYDKNSKPSWKKHIWAEAKPKEARLLPSNGFAINGLTSDHSVSLFLLTKAGKLIERRLNQRKWKWIVHGSFKDNQLTSITPSIQQESTRNLSLFFSTSTGSVIEYRIPKNSGSIQEKEELWINHKHPINAKAARGISGLPIQPGRVVFALNDGRLAELHLPGLGGENIGPNHQMNMRRKSPPKFGWSVLDVPETEGWNAEYCKEERGPTNCVAGAQDDGKSIARRRKGGQNYNLVAVATDSGEIWEEIGEKDDKIGENFRLRVMQGGKSFFLITGGGLAFEYLNTDEVWLWLRHDFPAAMKAAVGNYNGSLFLVDGDGDLMIRERSGDELTWLNCSAMRKGKKVASGPPWDGIPGKPARITPEDALFFVGKTGRLIQFTVALRKFKWKDCRNPRGTKIAAIVDQEQFRGNIVFVIGINGRLYQYNKVTELWHEHHQSRHLTLSGSPGTAARGAAEGSLFMISAEGGLIEYNYAAEGWNWVEHGPPEQGVVVAAPPSPCFEGNQLFLIGSNGEVYMRFMEDMNWKWKNCGFPHWRRRENGEICIEKELLVSLEKEEESLGNNRNCDPKVASTRPMPFSDDSVIFELRDGRLAEMRRTEGSKWAWSRIIGTPTSLCLSSYWTAVAS